MRQTVGLAVDAGAVNVKHVLKWVLKNTGTMVQEVRACRHRECQACAQVGAQEHRHHGSGGACLPPPCRCTLFHRPPSPALSLSRSLSLSLFVSICLSHSVPHILSPSLSLCSLFLPCLSLPLSFFPSLFLFFSLSLSLWLKASPPLLADIKAVCAEHAGVSPAREALCCWPWEGYLSTGRTLQPRQNVPAQATSPHDCSARAPGAPLLPCLGQCGCIGFRCTCHFASNFAWDSSLSKQETLCCCLRAAFQSNTSTRTVSGLCCE